jgi:tRNA threonylcarbamoyladenosine biosynthesis protein TsaE
MSIDSTLLIKSTSYEHTERLGQAIGARLKGGEVIELKSDLGGGKTTFTRGLVAGAKSTDEVASPTFTISRLYTAPTFTIHHFDFYRLQEPGIIANELEEILDDPSVVIVVEWGDIVAEVLPAERIVITFSYAGESEREITVTPTQKYQYITQGINV